MSDGIFNELGIGLPVREMMLEPTKLSLHPAVELFPEMDAEAFESFKADIQANGQTHAVVATEDGRIIDGRHRWKVCIALCLRISVRKFWGEEEDILPHVISSNLQRRHLTESQRAMVAAKMANMGEGRPATTAQICAVNNEPQATPISQSEAADKLNVSRRAVQSATVVRNEGAPELVSAVERGSLPVSVAAKAAKTLTKQEQIDVLKNAPGKLGKVITKVINEVEAKKREIEETNKWVEETNAKMRGRDFDPVKERARMQAEGKLYSAIAAILELPEPAEALAAISPQCEYRLGNLDAAVAWINDFSKLYKESRKNEAV